MTVNYGFYSRNVMAREKALYCGHAVAAVAATSAGIAEQALAAIDVDYEILQPVLNAQDAMCEDAPVLHDRLVTLANPNLRQGGWGRRQRQAQQCLQPVRIQAWRPGRRVRRGRRGGGARVPHQASAPGLHRAPFGHAQWSTDGSVTIWASSQGHFALRDHTAAILGVSVSRLKIIPMEIGGGFGGKGQGGCYLEPVVAALSRKCGQPVKIAMTRAEVFEGTGPTSPATSGSSWAPHGTAS